MKSLEQISKIFAILLISAAVIGLIAWRFMPPESEPAAAPEPAQLPQPVVTNAQTSATQNSTAVTPVVAPVTEPVAAPVAESGEDSHEHDEQIEPPSPAIVDAIREMKKPTPDEGKMTKSPDGSVKVNLGNRFQSVPIATVGKDGKVHVDYHGEKYLQDNQAVEKPTPEETKKPEEQKQEAPTP